jgi:hypothetical protein
MDKKLANAGGILFSSFLAIYPFCTFIIIVYIIMQILCGQISRFIYLIDWKSELQLQMNKI